MARAAASSPSPASSPADSPVDRPPKRKPPGWEGAADAFTTGCADVAAAVVVVVTPSGATAAPNWAS